MSFHRIADVTEQSIEDLRAVFAMFDRDKSRTIDANEFAEILSLLPPPTPPTAAINMYMRRAAGVEPHEPVPAGLTFRQFLNFFAIHRRPDSKPVHDHEVYKVLDANGDSKLDCRELRMVLQGFGMTISEAESKAMVKVMKEGRREFGWDQFKRLRDRVDRWRVDGHLSASDDEDEHGLP